MLPAISLDDEQFEEIIEKARKMIPNLYSEWTDYNYHDPGITMLELLAWLKEMQQFHMDQIGQEHIRRYLMLLGGKQRSVSPAKAIVSVEEPDKVGWLLKGSRFFAGNIPFETMVPRYISQTKISQVTIQGKSYIPNKNLHLPMFGSLEKPEPYLDICFSAPLEKAVEHQLYFRLFHDDKVKRNPIVHKEHFVPLAEIAITYRHEGRFLPIEWKQDETHQFLEDGFISLKLNHDMEPEENGEYVLRILLKESQYEMMPVLEEVSLHELEVRQIHTLCECFRWKWKKGEEPIAEIDTFLGQYGNYEIYLDTEAGMILYKGTVDKWQEQGKLCFALTEISVEEAGSGMILCYEEEMESVRFLGVGDGLPGQEVEIEIQGLCRKGMELLVETEEGSKIWRQWKQVEDFSCCGPEEYGYTFDEEQGLLTFGNGIRGQVPEGRILLAAGHTSLGKKGNVKAKTIKDNRTVLGFRTIVNQDSARQGTDKESLEECRIRVQKNLRQVERAVTYEDYEMLARRTQGLMIDKVRAIPAFSNTSNTHVQDDHKVVLVVKPYSSVPRPKPGQAYMENIRNMLESRRLIGTKVSILAPEYIGIIIFAEVETDSYHIRIKKIVKQILEEYFQRQENDFGKTVSYGDIYGLLDAVDYVVRVKSLSLDGQGNGVRRGRNGDILLPPNGLAYLREWECMVSLTE